MCIKKSQMFVYIMFIYYFKSLEPSILFLNACDNLDSTCISLEKSWFRKIQLRKQQWVRWIKSSNLLTGIARLWTKHIHFNVPGYHSSVDVNTNIKYCYTLVVLMVLVNSRKANLLSDFADNNEHLWTTNFPSCLNMTAWEVEILHTYYACT